MIEVLTIGSEILSGAIADTNAHTICSRLSLEGWEVARITSLPDDPQVLREALDSAFKRARVVITTGGLGPTCDDLTMALAAEYFGLSLEFNPHVAADIESRYGKGVLKEEVLRQQATLPKGAIILPNRLGTASALRFEREGRYLMILPGVPAEMRPLLEEEVVPFLQTLSLPKWERRSFYFCLLFESLIDPFLRTLDQRVQVGIYPSYGTVGVTLSAQSTHLLGAAEKELLSHFGTYFYSSTDKRIERALHQLFIEKGLTLALAESCTGGMISGRLCQIPGASKYFLGSVVSYSNPLKEKLLGVSPETLTRFGAVSEQVVIQMAEGALHLSGADYAIAVSGVAGPEGGTEEKPVGTIYLAFAKRGEGTIGGRIATKGRKKRETIIEYTGTYALAAIWRWLTHGKKPFATD